MRTINFPFQTYSKTLTAASQAQPSQIVPNLGPLQGIFCVPVSYTHLTLPTNREV